MVSVIPLNCAAVFIRSHDAPPPCDCPVSWESVPSAVMLVLGSCFSHGLFFLLRGELVLHRSQDVCDALVKVVPLDSPFSLGHRHAVCRHASTPKPPL